MHMLKFLFLLSIVIFSGNAFSQESNFFITGSVEIHGTPGKVYLKFRRDDITVIDSTIAINGKFKFKGNISEPVQGFIFLNTVGDGFDHSNDRRDIYIEQGNIHVISPNSSIAAAEIGGTPSNEDNKIFMAMVKPTSQKYNALILEKSKATPEQLQSKAFSDAIDSLIEVSTQESLNARIAFIEKNPKSFVSLIQLNSLTYFKLSEQELRNMFGNLVSPLKESELGKELAKKIAAMRKLAIGSNAPEIILPDVNGKLISLSSFKGKYVLIDFWASWCLPCRRENPNIAKVYQQYKDNNFEVLGVSLDTVDDRELWLKAIQNDGITWLQVSDLNGMKSKSAALYNISAIPQNYLIGPDGKIVNQNLKGIELEHALEKIFDNKAN